MKIWTFCSFPWRVLTHLSHSSPHPGKTTPHLNSRRSHLHDSQVHLHYNYDYFPGPLYHRHHSSLGDIPPLSTPRTWVCCTGWWRTPQGWWMCGWSKPSWKRWESINISIFYPLSGITVKSRFSEYRFNVKSRFKVQNVMIEMEFHIRKSRFSLKSRFMVQKCADWGHSLNQNFTVLYSL